MSQSTLIVGALLLGFVIYTMIVGTFPKYLGFIGVTGGSASGGASNSGSGTPATLGSIVSGIKSFFGG
jgi:hypothetical protein